jgi:hypothetical protein
MANPLKPIAYNEIKAMTDAWQNGLCQVSTNLLRDKYPDRPAIEEARSAWIGRADIDKLLSDNHANGLRIYFGCHDKSTLPDSSPHEYLGLHNIILVATLDSVNPDKPTPENSVDQLNKASTAVPKNGSFEGSGGDLVPLCPPACPGS